MSSLYKTKCPDGEMGEIESIRRYPIIRVPRRPAKGQPWPQVSPKWANGKNAVLFGENSAFVWGSKGWHWHWFSAPALVPHWHRWSDRLHRRGAGPEGTELTVVCDGVGGALEGNGCGGVGGWHKASGPGGGGGDKFGVRWRVPCAMAC